MVFVYEKSIIFRINVQLGKRGKLGQISGHCLKGVLDALAWLTPSGVNHDHTQLIFLHDLIFLKELLVVFLVFQFVYQIYSKWLLHIYL